MTITRDERTSQAELMRRKRAAEREIAIPKCKNYKRRTSCKSDLVKFVRTYFSKPPDSYRYPGKRGLACLELSPLHESILQEFQMRIIYGGLEALAAPRGFGKDTMACMAAIWASFYGHSRFIILACYEERAAESRMDMIKDQIETNRWLMDDFPQICAPIRALERAAQRAKQQTYRGEFTRVEWGREIVLPTIPKSAASGSIIAPASLSGSVRGMNKNGVRPSFVIISDPQTDEVAKSPTQIDDAMRRIHQDFGGLGAVDRPLAALALVTIIRRHDVADQLTDSKETPQWSGKRFKAIEAWPERMDLWDQYEATQEAGLKEGDATGRKANAFYLENRAEMDRGAKVSWESAFIPSPSPDGSPLENSALQHFMNLRWKLGSDAFETEYQNEPPELESGSNLTPDLIASRLSLWPPAIVPEEYEKLVQFIDVGGREIHYAVLACKADGSGSFIDYGRVKVDAPDGDLADPGAAVRQALEHQILLALRRRRDEVAIGESPYKRPNGDGVEISMTMVDSGWLPGVVYLFCQESGPRWLPSKGDQAAPGNRRYTHPTNGTHGVKTGEHWHARRQEGGTWLHHLDADHWKLFVQERFAQSDGTPGAWSLYGNDPREHRMFAKHICAEEWDATYQRFERRSKWNHFLDCAAGCGAAASMVGIRLLGNAAPKREPVNLAEWFKRQDR